MSEQESRPSRPGSIDGVAWTLFDAFRASSGLGLGYFVRADLSTGDRRVELGADVEVGRLDDGAFEALFESARELTSTERRVVAEDGSLWLAQAVGPVWAEGGVAAGTTGVRLTCVSASRPIVEPKGLGPEASETELLGAIAAAGLPSDTPTDQSGQTPLS